MEPKAPMWALLTTGTVDGGEGNGVDPTTKDNNNETMALAVMASLTDGGSSNGGRCHRLCSSG